VADLLEQLAALPDSWGLVAVGADKRPYQPEWQKHPLTKELVAAEIIAGRAKAVGVIAGPASGGLLFVDHDGLGASTVLEQCGAPRRELPKSWAVTSGRDARFQIIYRVPEAFWPQIKTKRIKSPVDGEQLELRWTGCQSVVLGAHPSTAGYRWMKGRSPADLPLADAPSVLLQQMMRQPEQPPLPLTPVTVVAGGGTVPLLEFIAKDSRQLIESGGTPGFWNDDQLRLALDLIGTEEWIRRQGATPDLTAKDAYAQHITAARLLAPDFSERKAWHRFEGAPEHNPTPSTPEDKLLDRLRFHSRRSLIPPNPRRMQQAAPQPAPAASQTAAAATVGRGDGRLQKLDPDDLINLLRVGQFGELRWNVFTQQIELDRKPIEQIELYYLKLAQLGFKVSKELAVDAIVHVAHETTYDPVREYLDGVAATVPPTSIDHLATAYLRRGDEPGTIYDEMIKRTLIAAVRRIYEPGSKHDSACVLLGDQGCGKSTFWRNLGGTWFSDALRDISSKDDLMVLHRSWIMEWAELDYVTSRKHAGQVKAFLSQSVDFFRLPYARNTEEFRRRTVIVGSTNRDTGFLVDDTGNRRFWVIPVTATQSDMIDVDGLLMERDAIWSAAVHAYRNRERNHLTAKQQIQVERENANYMVNNPWQTVVQSYLERRASIEPLTVEELLTQAIMKPVERQTRADQIQVGQLLKDLGYERRREATGRRRWIYAPRLD
jgi:predicted P-loop ATPase